MSLSESAGGVKLSVNDLLQVEIPDDLNPFDCRSRVDDVVRGGLLIAWPTDRGTLVPLHENQTLRLSFMRDESVYSFGCIIEEVRHSPFPQLRVLAVGAPQRIQRRQFFRVKSALPVELIAQSPEAKGEEGTGKPLSIRTHLNELSGSGMSIVQPDSVRPGTLLAAKLKLPEESSEIKILCKVIHATPVKAATGKTACKIGMFFLSVNESDRTRIVRHVFRVEPR